MGATTITRPRRTKYRTVHVHRPECEMQTGKCRFSHFGLVPTIEVRSETNILDLLSMESLAALYAAYKAAEMREAKRYVR